MGKKEGKEVRRVSPGFKRVFMLFSVIAVPLTSGRDEERDPFPEISILTDGHNASSLPGTGFRNG